MATGGGSKDSLGASSTSSGPLDDIIPGLAENFTMQSKTAKQSGMYTVSVRVCTYVLVCDVCACDIQCVWLEREHWSAVCCVHLHPLLLMQVQGSNSKGDGSPYPSVKVTNYNVNNNSVSLTHHWATWLWRTGICLILLPLPSLPFSSPSPTCIECRHWLKVMRL